MRVDTVSSDYAFIVCSHVVICYSVFTGQVYSRRKEKKRQR